jgi:hypothetical protein
MALADKAKALALQSRPLIKPWQVLVFVRIGGLDPAETGDVGNGSGPSDFCSCTLKVPRSAVGSGSGRPEPARPMSQLGRLRSIPPPNSNGSDGGQRTIAPGFCVR